MSQSSNQLNSKLVCWTWQWAH